MFPSRFSLDPLQLTTAIGCSSLIVLYLKSRQTIETPALIALSLINTIIVYAGWRFGIIVIAMWFTCTQTNSLNPHRELIQSKKNDSNSQQPSPNKISSINNEKTLTLRIVLCNTLPCMFASVAYYRSISSIDQRLQFISLPLLKNPDFSTFVLGFYLCYISCITANQWATDIGQLYSDRAKWLPKMSRRVPAGTNGGVTWAGSIAALCGALMIGITFYLSSEDINDEMKEIANQHSKKFEFSKHSQYISVIICCFAGAFGTFIDSILGSTLQFSGYDIRKRKIVNVPGPKIIEIKNTGIDVIHNETATFVSALCSGIVGGWIFVMKYCR